MFRYKKACDRLEKAKLHVSILHNMERLLLDLQL